MLSCVLLFANPWTVACPGSPVDGILQARILEWVGLLFPSPGHLPDPGVVLGSPALQTDSLLSEPPGRPLKSNYFRYIIGLFPILAMERTYFVWLLFFEFVDVCFTTQTIVCLGQSAISSLKKKMCVLLLLGRLYYKFQFGQAVWHLGSSRPLLIFCLLKLITEGEMRSLHVYLYVFLFLLLL